MKQVQGISFNLEILTWAKQNYSKLGYRSLSHLVEEATKRIKKEQEEKQENGS